MEGAKDGIEYYIGQQSDITKLTNGEVSISLYAGCIMALCVLPSLLLCPVTLERQTLKPLLLILGLERCCYPNILLSKHGLGRADRTFIL